MATRVLVVDDSALFRNVVTRALEGIEGVELAGFCSDGREALETILAKRPDIVTLDIEMPEVNGLEVLDALQRLENKPEVIVVSGVAHKYRNMTMRALELGALDFITKPDCQRREERIAGLRRQLIPVLAAAVRRLRRKPQRRTEAVPPAVGRPPRVLDEVAVRMKRIGAGKLRPAIALIGVSTGGPIALAQIIPQLPASLRVPVIIVQHMPPMFTVNLAAHLNAQSPINVQEAVNGEIAFPGTVYIAPGGSHLKAVRGRGGETRLFTTMDPPENNCRPAVDYLFRSVAETMPGRAVAAVLTGMGADGTEGLKELKKSGCLAIAQDEATSVVFGMPKEAIKAGVIDFILPLHQIADAIVKAVGN
ncbi:MAG: chemotaxis response regulator protein-glutamate methylesterase [Bryobacterales bacterium]|nr:chemotaxis response regulator protein-glutamate methylesterase [Bryobacterales bacterium]